MNGRNRPWRIGIIGAGRMGSIRARSARAHPACEVVHIVDTEPARAAALAREMDCAASADWAEVVARPDIDAVVVATTHKELAPITAAALEAGKRVFCEKPMARNASEARRAVDAAARREPGAGAPLVVGYTLRHHPAVARARQLVRGGAIGRPLYLRARYGHGGRPGYDREWRADRELSGGGELVDQGVHLIDLSRWLLGDLDQVSALVENCFWRGPAGGAGPVEDNAFLLLKGAHGQVASLHASWTQWRNLFALEIFGEDGFLIAEGLGGSYGPEQLLWGRRRPEGGAPAVAPVSLAELDGSVWDREWSEFVRAAWPAESGESATSATGLEGWQVLRTVEAAYLSAREGRTVGLN